MDIARLVGDEYHRIGDQNGKVAITEGFSFSFCCALNVSKGLTLKQIAAILLSLFFAYDVFFVFITPLFTKNGDSIMEDVATGSFGLFHFFPFYTNNWVF